MVLTYKKYIVKYTNVDNPVLSEVYGVYSTREKAIDALLLAANFREKNGMLTQYMKLTNDYESLSSLRNIVRSSGRLEDTDIYTVEDVSHYYVPATPSLFVSKL